MFSKFGIGEIILILVVVLLIFGPSKLPQLGKSIGDTLKEFKKSMKSTDEEPAAAAADKKEPEKKS